MHPFTTTALLALSSLLPRALALVSNDAIVTIESSHGGAGEGLTNLTVTIPLTSTYTNQSALAEVSTLYLVGSHGVPVDSIACTPFRYANGSGDAGLPFNTSSPSYISTNTVDIGSIVCISSDISLAPPGGPGGPLPLSSSSAPKSGNLTRTRTSKHGTSATAATSTLVKTTSAGSGPGQSTVTSTVGGATSGSGTPSSTASGSAALSSGNAASGLSLGSEFFSGLALAGFGLAFVL